MVASIINDNSFGVFIRKNHSWSKMLARVFKVDVTRCEHCGGCLKNIAAIVDSGSVARFLSFEGLDVIPPQRGPPEFIQKGFAYEWEV